MTESKEIKRLTRKVVLDALVEPSTPAGLLPKVKQVYSGVYLALVYGHLREAFKKGEVLASDVVRVKTANRVESTVFYAKPEHLTRGRFELSVYDEQLGKEIVKPVRFHQYTKENRGLPRRRRFTSKMVLEAIKKYEEESGMGMTTFEINRMMDNRDVSSHLLKLAKKGKLVRIGMRRPSGAISKISRHGYVYATSYDLAQKKMEDVLKRGEHSPVQHQVMEYIRFESEYRRQPTSSAVFYDEPFNIKPQQVSYIINNICRLHPTVHKSRKIENRIYVWDSAYLPDEEAEKTLKKIAYRESEYFTRKVAWGRLIEIVPEATFSEMWNKDLPPEKRRFGVKFYDVYPNLYIPKNPYIRELDLLGYVEYFPEITRPRNWAVYYPVSCKAVGGGMTVRNIVQFYNQLRYHTEEYAIKLPNGKLYYSGTIFNFNVSMKDGTARTYMLEEITYTGQKVRHPIHVLRANIHPLVVASTFTKEAKKVCNRLGITYIYAGVEIEFLSEWVLGQKIGLRDLRTKFHQEDYRKFKAERSKLMRKKLREWFYREVLQKKALA